MQFEKLIDGFGALEAPRVDDRGNLYFSDIIFGGLYKRASDGTLQHLLAEQRHIGGLVFNHDGRLIGSGQGGLFYFDESSGAVTPLLTHIDGRAIEVGNDIHTDAQGNIYGGVIDFNSLAAGRAPEYGYLYRLTPSGDVTVIARQVGVANGIGFSPDHRRLYYSDTLSGVRVVELEGDQVGSSRLFADLPGADGLAVDAEGGVWVACYSTSEVVRFHPDGSVEQRIAFDAKMVLSLCFGGQDLRDLYVVTADDFHNPVNRAAAVYRARSDVAGQALAKARF